MSLPDNQQYLWGVAPSACDFDQVWEKVIPLIDRAIEYADGKYGAEDIYKALKNREMQLWVAFTKVGALSAFCITKITHYPREKRGAILFASGHNVMEWLPFCKTIQNWARENGCTSMEVYGRRGWKKLLKQYGHYEIHTVLKVDLPSLH